MFILTIHALLVTLLDLIWCYIYRGIYFFYAWDIAHERVFFSPHTDTQNAWPFSWLWPLFVCINVCNVKFIFASAKPLAHEKPEVQTISQIPKSIFLRVCIYNVYIDISIIFKFILATEEFLLTEQKKGFEGFCF